MVWICFCELYLYSVQQWADYYLEGMRVLMTTADFWEVLATNVNDFLKLKWCGRDIIVPQNKNLCGTIDI